MEMFYFIFGALSVVALFGIGVLIAGMVKMRKQKNNFDSFVQEHGLEMTNVYREFEIINRELEDSLSVIRREFDDRNKDLLSYVDRRFDKTISVLTQKEN